MAVLLEPTKDGASRAFGSYRADIDGLRAVAVLAVVGYHVFPEWIPGGFVGVDIFFVISGYLITKNIFEDLKTNSFSFSGFYFRRVRRIFPALLTVLAGSFVVGWFTLLAGEYQQLGKHIAGGAGFITNILLWKESGYFDTSAETKPLLQLWSLGVEEQFYLLYPFMLWFAWRWGRRVFHFILGICVVSFLLNVVLIHKDPSLVFYFPHTRFWEFMLGALVLSISYFKSKKAQERSFAHLSSWLGLIFICSSIVMINKKLSFPGVWALLPTLGTGLLIAAGMDARVNQRILSNRRLVWIGRISYPLYLWHWIILSFPRIIEGTALSAALRLTAVFISIVLAWLTYRFIESPIRFGDFGRGKALGLVVSLTFTAMIGFYAFHREGLTFRNAANPIVRNEGDTGQAEFHQYIREKFFPCESADILNNAPTWEGHIRCFQSKRNEPVDLVLLGDSHAEHLFIGLAEGLPRKNVSFYIQNSLPVVRNGDFNFIFQNILASRTVKNVVISAYWAARGMPVSLLDPTIKQLRKAGKMVALTEYLPEFPFEPSLCKYERILRNESVCDMDYEVFYQRYEICTRTLHQLTRENPGVQLINISSYLCDSSHCSMSRDGKLLYRDKKHLNINGSKYVGSRILRDHPYLN